MSDSDQPKRDKPSAKGAAIDVSSDVISLDDWLTISETEAESGVLNARLRVAQIPKRYRNKTIETFMPRSATCRNIAESAREYVDRFKSHEGAVDGLMLQGPVGCGKTHIAIAMLRELMTAGYSGLYCNVPEFFKEVRRTYNSYTGPDESFLIDETRGVDVLVLDDLGVEGRVLDPVRDKSKWLCERMYLIVNGRYDADKPIIMTTNCDLTSLADQFDERTVSRLAEMTRAPFPKFPEQDYRKLHLK